MGVTLEFQARDMIQGTKLNDATQLFVGMWVCDWKIEDKILKLTKQLKFRQANWTNEKYVRAYWWIKMYWYLMKANKNKRSRRLLV